MGKGEECNSIRILNRIVSWFPDRVEYEADQRHAEIIVQQMGLGNSKRSVITPAYKRDAKRNPEYKDLEPSDATQYRALVARANYLAQDRSDIKFAVKELCRRMAAPKDVDWEALKRLARYLNGCPRAISTFARQNLQKFITGWSDSDWAGCVDTRKSTSGGVMIIGSHVIKT